MFPPVRAELEDMLITCPVDHLPAPVVVAQLRCPDGCGRKLGVSPGAGACDHMSFCDERAVHHQPPLAQGKQRLLYFDVEREARCREKVVVAPVAPAEVGAPPMGKKQVRVLSHGCGTRVVMPQHWATEEQGQASSGSPHRSDRRPQT